MVMTGAAPSSEVNSSLTHRAIAIGAFFGKSLMSGVTGGSDAEEKLSIESGAKISEQGKETYDIEYKLSDRWTLTGEYDEFDQYIAGLKWRLAPKKRER
jgi:translocation and assembly module TamB